MENQDKPGYKEDFKANYIWPFLFTLALAVASVMLYLFADDNGGIAGAIFFAAVAVFTFFYGLYQYRKTYRKEIRNGERDKGW